MLESFKFQTPGGNLLSGFARFFVLVILGMTHMPVNATDIEPRAYSNIPEGLNFLIAGYSYVKGNIAFAPAIPIENAKLETQSSVFAYVRSLDIWGKSAKFDIIIPQAWLSGTADVSGQPKERKTGGFADPIFRFYVNFYGAPALSMKEFANYQQDTIIGASLAITVPGGQAVQVFSQGPEPTMTFSELPGSTDGERGYKHANSITWTKL